MFGDKDLFDVWDDGDPLEHRVALLVRIAAELRTRSTPHRRAEALRLLGKLVGALAELDARLDGVRADIEAADG